MEVRRKPDKEVIRQDDNGARRGFNHRGHREHGVFGDHYLATSQATERGRKSHNGARRGFNHRGHREHGVPLGQLVGNNIMSIYCCLHYASRTFRVG